MRKLALSLLAGGFLALPAFADTVSTGVAVTNNAGSAFYSGGADKLEGTDYYAAFNPGSGGWPISIKDYVKKGPIYARNFNLSDDELDLCSDLIDTSSDSPEADGILLAGIQIDPGSVVHLTFQAPTALTNVSDPSYKIAITKVQAHMCYYYLGDGNFKSISSASDLNDKFNFFNDNAEYKEFDPSTTTIDEDVNIYNLTGEDNPSDQVKVYFIFDPVYQFPEALKSGIYKGDFTISLTAE